MSDTEKKILIIDSDRAPLSEIRHHLTKKGCELVSAPFTAHISSLCKQQDIDLIITCPTHTNHSDFFMRPDLPTVTPILGIGIQPEACNGFSGIASCFPDTLSENNLHSQVEFLCTVKRINDSLLVKDDKLKAISEKLEEQQQSMELHSEFLEIVALRDGLTGLFNRRHLNTLLPKEFEKAIVNSSELTMLLIDIDYFYELNKSAGTSFGDFVLNDFAARLTAASQPNGICFRFSGETFVALLRDVTITEASSLAESLQKNLEDRPFIRNKKERSITVSIGIASLNDHRPENPDDFVSMAERALFFAKSEGRDRITIFNINGYDPLLSSNHNLSFLRETISRILSKTRTSSVDSIQLLARDIGGNNNRGHIENVRSYVDLLGKQMNLPETIIETFKNAITLHTSIRFLLHNELISKEERFTDDDREIMADFPYKLAELTEMFDYFSNERAILLCHGERFDGSGYPDGLKGDEIPLGARIFALVDALAAMKEDRPYRNRLEPEKILEELVEGAGTQFDPHLVVKMLEIIKNHEVLELPNQRIEAAITNLSDSPATTSS